MSEYRKKLIEVSLPLAAINAESAREKSIRHGHPSTLHLWWARRPLAACRAVLFASLVDDPDSDPAYQRADGTVDEDAAGIKRAELFNLIEELVAWENSNNPDVIRSARAEIARCVASRKLELGELNADEEIASGITIKKFIRDCRCMPIFVGTEKNKKKSDKRRFHFNVSHLPAAELVNAFLAKHAPPLLDPFCGGGSIPLEAQRLGLRAFASDLNPVPVLINKALIEIPPKFAGRLPVNPESRGQEPGSNGERKKPRTLIEKDWPGASGLAEDVRYYGKWMRDEAEKRIGHLYPKVEVTEEMAKDRPDLKPYVGKKLTVIAWLWARTVVSPSPVYRDVHVPLISSYWLSKKAGKLAWLDEHLDRNTKRFWFTPRVGTPKAEEKKSIDAGTKLGRGCKFRCILSDEPIPESHIKGEALAGRVGVCPMVVVAEGTRGRVFLEAVPVPAVDSEECGQGIDAPLANDPRNLWCLGYGLDTFNKLFTDRQIKALGTFCDLITEARQHVVQDYLAEQRNSRGRSTDIDHAEVTAYADAVAVYLALGVSRSSDYWSSLCIWRADPKNLGIGHVFARQALQMVWDFAEANPFSDSSGNWTLNLQWITKVLESLNPGLAGRATQLDATSSLQVESPAVISTDPPYYDNIGYSDLSDFFYVWLRRALGAIDPQLFATLVTPKSQELIASPYRFGGSGDKAKEFFEDGLGNAFSLMHEKHSTDIPLTVYYAFKQSESDDEDSDDSDDSITTASTGWETMLEGLLKSNFSISGTWPMRTELGNRTISRGTNALASSIVLVCRPRPDSAVLATRKEFLTALRHELPEALRNLQHGNIAPVDLAQSAIGPGMAVFTRYAKVLESDGGAMSVRTALGLINQTLDEVLAEQEGEFDSDTRWALSWFEQFGMEDGPFGDAETLSKAKNTAINGLVEAGIIVARSGKVRLIRRDELPANWNPATDKRLTIWEVTQHLIHRLDEQGESGAAELVNQLGGIGEIARDLAYRLYSTCERKKWAQEALAYNSLVVAWPELTKLARSTRAPAAPAQSELF